MDKMTQKSKGYGFVTFKGMDGAHAALENPEKMIDVSRSTRFCLGTVFVTLAVVFDANFTLGKHLTWTRVTCPH